MSVSKTAKVIIKSHIPRVVAAYKNARQTLIGPSLKTVFSAIYHTNGWQDRESVSGRGSTLARTKVIRSRLPKLLQELQAEILLDAACGDFHWMRNIDLGSVKYIGVDVVPDLINRNRKLYGSVSRIFLAQDITRHRLPSADVVLCRDCLIHLSFKRIHAAVANFKRARAGYFLCTNHPSVMENSDCPDGSWRSLNLLLPPFNFPPPLRQIVEDEELGKYLAVWRLEDL